MGRPRWLGLGSLGCSTLAASLANFWWRLVNPLDCLPVIFDAAPSQLAECANRAQVFQAIWLPLTLVGGLVLALLTWLVEVAFKLKADDEATSRREVQAMEDNKPRRSITGLSVSVRTGKGEPTPHFTGGFVCAHCGSQHGAITGVRPADEPLTCPTCGHVVPPDAQ